MWAILDGAIELEIPSKLNMAAYVVDGWIDRGHGDAPAWHTWERTYTYRDVYEQMNRAGNLLLARGVRRGDRVLVASRNTPPVLATVLGALKIGAIPMATSSLFRSSELSFILANSTPAIALGPTDLLELVSSLPGAPPAVPLDDESALAPYSAQLEPAELGAEDPAFIFYTSGTTGNPKGICHAQRYVIGDLYPLSEFYLDMRPDMTMFNPHEISFSYAFGWTLMIPLLRGASSILLAGRLEPAAVLRHIERFRATIFASVPALLQAMAAAPEASELDLSSVTRLVSAGSPLPPAQFGRLRELFPNAVVGEAIGQSECQTYICHWGLERGAVKPGSLGRPLPTYDCRILDDAGRDLPAGKIGHICIRADHPSLFREYWGLPDRYAEVHRGGWYFSGDLGHVDEDGVWWFDSRADDMIKSRGYLVSPDEVERVLCEHQAVAEVAVIGVPDERQGQLIRAYVVLNPGARATVDELRTVTRERLAPYKTPRDVVFVEALPRTATGKLRRNALRNN